MACDCQTKVQAELLKHYKEAHPTGTNPKLELGGYVYLMGGKVESKASLPVTFSADFPIKSGGQKNKKSKSYVTATYCPFCGVQY